MAPKRHLKSSSQWLLALKESQAVAKKEDILAAIVQLEESSRGWFESDEAFEARVKASQSAWDSKRKQAKKKPTKPASGTSTTAGSGAGGGNKWVTPMAVKKKVAPKATKPAGGGGVFQAMMMDSDSD